MFANKFKDEHPICPICEVKITTREDLVKTPTGFWIIHKLCVKAWNERAKRINPS